MRQPQPIVFASLHPSRAQPNAGLFIRERVSRIAKRLPLTTVSPKPWFPGQGLIRRIRPHYRPMPGRVEQQNGVSVLFPRFLALPGILRSLDGLSMALCSYFTIRRLRQAGHNMIDAHFAYPDGYAAVLLGRWLRLPVTVTLRGTEVPHSCNPALRRRLRTVLREADRIIAVSDSLRRLALELGMPEGKGIVVGNGVDTEKFKPMDRHEARARFGLSADTKVLITVGAMVERKGFHRVIACLPALLDKHPTLHYLIVGGASPEGNMESELRAQVARLGLGERVHFLGQIPPIDLKWPLSAADVFVLATRNEGWANVILEAMACGLPVVATDVGGNREVIRHEGLGSIVPFGDMSALTRALDAALAHAWDRARIRAYAVENDWDHRIESLLALYTDVLKVRAAKGEA